MPRVQITVYNLFVATTIAAIFLGVFYYTGWLGLFVSFTTAFGAAVLILLIDSAAGSQWCERNKKLINFSVVLMTSAILLGLLLPPAISSGRGSGRSRLMVPVNVAVFADGQPVSGAVVNLTSPDNTDIFAKVACTDINGICEIPHEFLCFTFEGGGKLLRYLIVDDDVQLCVQADGYHKQLMPLTRQTGQRSDISRKKAARLNVSIALKPIHMEELVLDIADKK